MTKMNNFKKFNLHPNFYSFEKSTTGIQYLFKFDVLAVSVVRGFGTFGYQRGLYEMAIGELDEHGNFHLRYDTPITDDVIGYLSVGEVIELLGKVKRLKNIKSIWSDNCEKS